MRNTSTLAVLCAVLALFAPGAWAAWAVTDHAASCCCAHDGATDGCGCEVEQGPDQPVDPVGVAGLPSAPLTTIDVDQAIVAGPAAVPSSTPRAAVARVPLPDLRRLGCVQLL